MKKIAVLLFFYILACKQPDGTKELFGNDLRSFTAEELVVFENEIDAIGKVETALAKAQDPALCYTQNDAGYTQGVDWLVKTLYVAQISSGSCPMTGKYTLKKKPTDDQWETSVGFNLSKTVAKQAGISGFYFSWTGEKKNGLKIKGSGLWVSEKKGRVLFELNSEKNITTLSFFYTDFKVVITVDKSNAVPIIIRGQDRIDPRSFDYLQRLGLITENISL